MTKFQTIVTTLPDRESVVVEVLYDDIQWVEIDQEAGVENLQIHFYFPAGKKKWEFNFSEAVEQLRNAEKRLTQRDKNEDLRFKEGDFSLRRAAANTHLLYKGEVWATLSFKDEVPYITFLPNPSGTSWEFPINGMWSVFSLLNEQSS